MVRERMATSGRRLVTVALVGALALASCSGASRGGSDGQRASSSTTASSFPSWSGAAKGVVPPAVRNGIEKAWRADWPATVLPFQSTGDGTDIVASVSGNDFTGIALVAS